MRSKLYTKGFTLIELLVVIAIIGLLSSVVLSNLAVARTKGAITKDIQAVKQFQTALELYRSDNSAYPDTGSAPQRGFPWFNGNIFSCGSNCLNQYIGDLSNPATAQYIPAIHSGVSNAIISNYGCGDSTALSSPSTAYLIYWVATLPINFPQLYSVSTSLPIANSYCVVIK